MSRPMSYQTDPLTGDQVVDRARKEAEKLTTKLDQANEERKLKPLMASREEFVRLMTCQLAKIFVHRAIIKS